jgi:hypothetical protein
MKGRIVEIIVLMKDLPRSSKILGNNEESVAQNRCTRVKCVLGKSAVPALRFHQSRSKYESTDALQNWVVPYYLSSPVFHLPIPQMASALAIAMRGLKSGARNARKGSVVRNVSY